MNNVWRLSSDTRAILLFAVVLELAGLIELIPPMFSVDSVDVPWAVIPGLIAFPFALRERKRPARHSLVHWAIAISLGAIFVGALGAYAVSVGPKLAGSVLLAVGLEEVVYRLALPALFAISLTRCGLSYRNSLIGALTVSAALFTLMPGHVEQMREPVTVLAFPAFAILMSHAVWRGGLLLIPIATHATVDFLSLGVDDGAFPAELRVAGVVFSLAAMVLLSTTARSEEPAVEEIDDDDVVIDLRDHSVLHPQAVIPAATRRAKSRV